MTSALKAELTKLLTIRSTYLLTLLAWIVVAAVSFLGVGLRSSAEELHNPALMQQSVFGSIQFIQLIAAVVAILMLAHEYRYNIINFSFTLQRSRSKVFASKLIILSIYSIILGLVSVVLVFLSVNAGAAVNNNSVGLQVYNVIGSSGLIGLMFQSVFAVWGLAMAGLIVTALLKNLVASIAFIFVFPGLENLVTLISDTLVKYLPFTSLNAITRLSPQQLGFSADKSLIIYLIYLVIFGAIAWRLFTKRDAN